MLSRFSNSQERTIAQLRQYWDSLVAPGKSLSEQSGLDPDLAATVQYIHRNYDAPSADPAYSAKLLEELTNASIGFWSHPSETENVTPVRVGSLFGGVSISPELPAQSRFRAVRLANRWALAFAGAAALIVFALLGGFFVWDQGRYEGPGAIPAIVIGTPGFEETPGIEREVLIDHQFAADAVPRNDDNMFVMNRAVVPPGESIAYPAESCGVPMLMAAAVESGVYSIKAESAVDVTWADSRRESVGPNTPTELSGGDTFIYTNQTSDPLSGFMNPGSEPLVVLQAIWFPEATCSYGRSDSPDRSQITWMNQTQLFASEAPEAFTLRFQHVTIRTFERLSEAQVAGFEIAGFRLYNRALLVVDSGRIVQYTYTGTNDARSPVRNKRLVIGETLNLEGYQSLGGNVELQKFGADPLEATVFTIVYEDPDSG